MITYTWKIEGVRVQPEMDGLQSVIRQVSYVVEALTDDGYAAKIKGSVLFETVDPVKFVPLEQLTNDTVISWLQSMLNVENIYATLDEKLVAERATNAYTPANLST